jgi:hypothetical protein
MIISKKFGDGTIKALAMGYHNHLAQVLYVSVKKPKAGPIQITR